MTVEVEIDGRVYRATVTRAGRTGAGLRVTLHGPDASAPATVQVVDARETDLGLSLLHADGRVVEAALAERARGEWLVQLPHVDVVARIDGRRAATAGGEARGTGQQRVCAPMPGRIVRLLVQPGEAVAAGQPLVVIEAMKMENALTAPRAGRVIEVAVAEGASVEAGRLLVRLE